MLWASADAPDAPSQSSLITLFRPRRRPSHSRCPRYDFRCHCRSRAALLGLHRGRSKHFPLNVDQIRQNISPRRLAHIAPSEIDGVQRHSNNSD